MSSPYKYQPEKIIEALEHLRLSVMRDAYQEVLDSNAFDKWNWSDKFGHIVLAEVEARSSRRQERLLKESGLRETACYSNASLDKLICTPERKLDRELLERLVTCDWIRSEPAGTVILSGATGTGKSWILNLLGRAACEQGLSVAYFRFPVLAERMIDAYDHRNSGSFRKRLNSKKLLLIDDFGLGSRMTPQLANDFLSLIEERMGFSATVVAGQVAPEEWYDFIGDSVSADALLDRLLNRSYRIDLEGPSLRETQSLKPLVAKRKSRSGT